MLKSLTLRSSRFLAVTGMLAFTAFASPSVAHAASPQPDGFARINSDQQTWASWTDTVWVQNLGGADVAESNSSVLSLGKAKATAAFEQGEPLSDVPVATVKTADDPEVGSNMFSPIPIKNWRDGPYCPIAAGLHYEVDSDRQTSNVTAVTVTQDAMN